MAIALNGTPVFGRKTFGGSSTFAMPNFSTSASTIVFLAVANINEGIASISGSSLGSFSKLAASSGASIPICELWGAYAPGALTNEVVTVTQVNNYDPCFGLFAFEGSGQTGVSGILETTVGNENGAFNNVLPRNFTNTNADCVVIGISVVNFDGGDGQHGTGWTLMSNYDGDPGNKGSNALNIQYMIKSTTGTETLTVNEDDEFVEGALITALIDSGGGPPPPTPKLNSGLDHIEAGSPMGKKTNGILHPIKHGIVGWKRELILPNRKIIKQAA